MSADRTLVFYVIDEVTDEVAATVAESVRLIRQLHPWEGNPPSGFDAVPGGLRTVGVGLRFADPFPASDRPGLVRLVEHLSVVAENAGVCLEVQLDETPIGLVAPEGVQPWVADELRRVFGLAEA